MSLFCEQLMIYHNCVMSSIARYTIITRQHHGSSKKGANPKQKLAQQWRLPVRLYGDKTYFTSVEACFLLGSGAEPQHG